MDLVGLREIGLVGDRDDVREVVAVGPPAVAEPLGCRGDDRVELERRCGVIERTGQVLDMDLAVDLARLTGLRVRPADADVPIVPLSKTPSPPPVSRRAYRAVAE